eukprot:TRINITY_DN9515_c0_g1_i1.p1 TRINITY_DN9515_c0_g1~~TRINITY_DN9515_c0_g1_i1.p1  ORF type:complete len:261 (-),score=43.75 TRINITY_DN9515_c0_g1_i1:1984-2649(-)
MVRDSKFGSFSVFKQDKGAFYPKPPAAFQRRRANGGFIRPRQMVDMAPRWASSTSPAFRTSAHQPQPLSQGGEDMASRRTQASAASRRALERKRQKKIAFYRRCKEKRQQNRLSRLPPITPIRFTSANDDVVLCTRSFPTGSFAFDLDPNVWGIVGAGGETSLDVEGEAEFEQRDSIRGRDFDSSKSQGGTEIIVGSASDASAESEAEDVSMQEASRSEQA